MFLASMPDGKIIKGIIEAMSVIIDETNLVAHSEQMDLTAMDESHICLVHGILKKELFEKYEIDQDEIKLGINLEDAQKIMKRVGASDAVDIFYDDAKGDKFQFHLKGKGLRTFSLRLVDIDPDKIPPNTELDVAYSSSVVIPIGIIDDAIKDAEIYQDTIEIKMLPATETPKSDSSLVFSAEGEVGDTQYEVGADVGTLNISEAARGVFSLAFMKNIIKMGGIVDEVTMYLADNAPLKVIFRLKNEAGEVLCEFVYFLAPRVEEDEDSYEAD
jgi:proliferating cell nuclear antigen